MTTTQEPRLWWIADGRSPQPQPTTSHAKGNPRAVYGTRSWAAAINAKRRETYVPHAKRIGGAT